MEKQQLKVKGLAKIMRERGITPSMLARDEYEQMLKVNPKDRNPEEKYFVDLIESALREFNKSTKPVKTLHKMVDRIIEKMDHTNIACKSGCHYCCHILTNVSRQEFHYIMGYVRKNKIPINTKYLKEQAECQGDEDLYYQLPKEKKRCPFLKESRCQIYEVRPMQCRKYLVAHSNANCKMAYETDSLGVSLTVVQNFTISTISMAWMIFSECENKILADYLLEGKHGRN